MIAKHWLFLQIAMLWGLIASFDVEYDRGVIAVVLSSGLAIANIFLAWIAYDYPEE